MIYEWDEAKRVANLVKHGVDFELVRSFEWNRALQWLDIRRDYGEPRWIAYGQIEDVLHMLVYTTRGEHTRVISLRRASEKEKTRYEAEILT